MLRRTLWTIAACLIVGRAAPAAEEGYFDSGGVKIHYQVEGSGEPVLLIHGFAANIPLQWGMSGVMRKLSHDYQVIALDDRGHGLSAKPHEPGKYGMEMVRDSIRLLDHLGIQKAHIVGYSMGAMIASKLMMTYPDRVLSATLGGGIGIRESTNIRFFARLADDLDQGRGVGALLTALTPIGRTPPTEQQLRFINSLFFTINDAKALAAVVRSWKDLAVPDDQWRANRIPTLAIIGENDPLRDNVDEVEPVMANLKVRIIRRADHMSTFNRPEFARLIQDWLALHSPPRAREHSNSSR
jgi:pimeloyl-ACP methyl ester carboxylesterase